MLAAHRFTFLALVLFFALPHRGLAAGLSTFKSCVPSFISLHLGASPAYLALKSLSFINDRSSPIAVARVKSEEQVQIVVKCARKAMLRVCSRSGGHSLIGGSLCEGVLIDVQDLRSVKVQSGGIIQIGGGANMGEVLWGAWHGGKRWMAAGVCPTVGVGGYIFGGGHGPYEGRLGMACDSLVSARLVNRFGDVVVASKTSKPGLFWALCGAGGGQFGIVTSFSMRTASSAPFDRAVIFRFNWPQDKIGELMAKWMDYGEEGGDVWFRMEMYSQKQDTGMFGYGACYDVGNTMECLNRLEKAEFFRVTGRQTVVLSAVNSALEVHSFFGPEGDWGRKPVSDVRKALIQQRGSQSGAANVNIYQSTFLNKAIPGRERPSAEFWQKYADFCANPGVTSFNWLVCELNLFNNAIDVVRDNAFAHRGADIITHYIFNGGSMVERLYVYNWMKNHFKPYTTGVYVNYPEVHLNQSYATAYWGKSLPRLMTIKKRYDPNLFFLNPQPVPLI